MRAFWLLLLLSSAIIAHAQPLAGPEVWLTHAEQDLGRFWLNDAYEGEPEGSFPTFICADGRVWDAEDPCPSLAEAGAWIQEALGRQYIRMLSRQIYTYGVIYHLTGNAEALERAQAGVRFIIEQAFDPATGSVASYLLDGTPGLLSQQRTTQDLAYALLGPAFFYYLTRDPAALALLRSVKDHIFFAYWSEEWQMLRWSNAADAPEEYGRQELVSQLDQINAYLLLMIPLLQGEERAVWEADLSRLIGAMLADFHDADGRRFYGYLHEPEGKVWGERHSDFGHTAKAYWMLYLAGMLLDEQEWVRTARKGLSQVLAAALIERDIRDAPEWQTGIMRRVAAIDGSYYVWANKPGDIGISAWEWCELDQSAATLALADDRYARYLEKTYPIFFATLVDEDIGGTYAFPGWTGSPKAHQWLNGYHVAEHALVGYITSALLHDQSFRLYFALPEEKLQAPVSAYYFDVPVASRSDHGETLGGLRRIEIEFSTEPKSGVRGQ